MTEKTFAVTARHEGRWWFVHVPELDTAGQARTLTEAEEVAKEVIGLYLDTDPTSLSVSITVDLPVHVQQLWEDAANREVAAREAASGAARMRREAVRSLIAQGVTQADAARALGLSPQRVSQLVSR